MQSSTRRNFCLKISRTLASLGFTSALARLGAINAFAQSNDYKALVCVFLFGGNDANSLVVPVSDQYDNYQSVRGSLAIPRANLLSMFTGTQELGLHPQMAPLHPLWAQGKMAIAANVGMLVRPLTREQYQNRTEPIPGNLFSHSDQILQWQTAPPQQPTGNRLGRPRRRHCSGPQRFRQFSDGHLGRRVQHIARRPKHTTGYAQPRLEFPAGGFQQL